MPRYEVVPLDVVEYAQAWELQQQLHGERVRADRPDTVLLLQHPGVYTAGRRTSADERPTDGSAVVDVDRGGRITWHGPGQLVGYPILKLDDPIDVVAYVRRLEHLLVDVCAALGLATETVAGRSGVWVTDDDLRPSRKVAAIGIRVARGVSLHGFAINCNPDLAYFSRIVPCGIDDATATSLSAELGRDVTVAEVTALVTQRLDMLYPARQSLAHAAAGPTGDETTRRLAQ